MHMSVISQFKKEGRKREREQASERESLSKCVTGPHPSGRSCFVPEICFAGGQTNVTLRVYARTATLPARSQGSLVGILLLCPFYSRGPQGHGTGRWQGQAGWAASLGGSGEAVSLFAVRPTFGQADFWSCLALSSCSWTRGGALRTWGPLYPIRNCQCYYRQNKPHLMRPGVRLCFLPCLQPQASCLTSLTLNFLL